MESEVAEKSIIMLDLGLEGVIQIFEKEHIMGGLPKSVKPIN